MTDQDKSYSLHEPGDESAEPGSLGPGAEARPPEAPVRGRDASHRVERSGDPSPLPLEDLTGPAPAAGLQPAPPQRDPARGRPLSPRSPADELPPRSVREYDICPNCGANMREADTLVCLRCGYDLKTMRVLQTRTGEVEVPAPGEAAAANGKRAPICVPGRGGWMLPAAIGGVGALAAIIGFLAAARGLFPVVEEGAAIAAGARFRALAGFLVFSAIEIGAGFAGLLAGARLLETRLGDARLALIRVAGIVGFSSLALFIGLSSPGVEVPLEVLAKVAISFSLVMLLFRMEAREAGIVTIAAVIAFFVLWLGIKALNVVV